MTAFRSARQAHSAPLPSRCFARPLWLRRITFGFALLFVWSFVFAAPVAALAQQPAAHPKPRPLSDDVGPVWRTVDTRSRPYISPAVLQLPAPLPTLLDEVGNLERNVSPAEARGWKRQLRNGRLPAALVLHLVALQAGGSSYNCGFPNSSLQCSSPICCPTDALGNGQGGPLDGDPVNLATRQEEFRSGRL